MHILCGDTMQFLCEFNPNYGLEWKPRCNKYNAAFAGSIIDECVLCVVQFKA
jgi:hypothetical protein